MRKTLAAAVAVLGAATAFAQTPTAAQQAEVAKAKANIEMLRVNNAVAVALSAGDAEKAGESYDAAATLMPPNGPMVRGRQAIVAFYKGLLAQGKVTLQISTISSAIDGGLAYDAGHYTMVMTPATGGPQSDSGKYLTVLRRGADGKWRLVCDAWSSELTAQ